VLPTSITGVSPTRIGAGVRVVDSHRLATDVDEPADLAELLIHAEADGDGGEGGAVAPRRRLRARHDGRAGRRQAGVRPVSRGSTSRRRPRIRDRDPF